MGLRLTEPLLAETDGLPVYSDGYRLVELVERYWTVKGQPLKLDVWQKHLLIRILERCPEGHPRAGQLRYRQVVVSIPRQAGKSLLAAILSLYGLLLHSHSPKVLGVARGTEQAKIVYGYTRTAIDDSPTLKAMFKQTEWHGISRIGGPGSYKVLPAKPESVQGYESTLSICDELHVMKPDIWNAIVESQTAQTNPILIGITTAGDITSVLLKTLYERGESALAGTDETFGFFVYESASEELSIESLTEANPAIACGRIDAATILADCQGQPRSQWMRYRLNRFVDGLAEPWVPVEAWAKCAGTGVMDFTDCIYSFDINPTHSHMSIVAAKLIDGVVCTSLVARVLKPTPEKQKAWADRLRKAGRCQFVMDPNRMRSLTEYLDDKGRNPIRIFGGRKSEAAGTVYAAVMRQEVNHDNQPFVNQQHATAKTKSIGDGFNIVPNGRDADACYASVYAIYGAIIKKERSLGIA